MPDASSYTDINAQTIDRWVAEGWEWGTPIDHETFARAQAGEWEIVLTPTKAVPRAWFPPLVGCRTLGLACGGGQQMPILTAAGARCTVLDNSLAMLEADKSVAEREGYSIEIVRADMTKPLPFEDASFDLVINPVSLCYVREVEPIWQEVARVLRPGGVLLAGFETVLNQIVDEDEVRIVRGHPADPLTQPDFAAELEAGDFGMQFSHSLDELLGGLLRAGFIINDLFEDTNGEGRLHELGIPTMLAVRATRAPRPESS
ncbi:MAG: class I SAM-dependent methyltransferase [Coriobacteriales bacterium]|nr:class I SAM-dependent methyltransferase [Coriobacteriales bacterium]